MTPLSFNKLCRTCLTTDGIKSTYMLTESTEDDKSMTEYEYSKIIEKWLFDDGKICQFCGCPYFQVDNVSVGDHKLYDFDRLVDQCKKRNGEFFIWDAIKKDGRIDCSTSGKASYDPLFIEECFAKLYKLVDDFPAEIGIPFEFGHLRMSFIGKFSKDFGTGTETFNPILQQLAITGLSFEEIKNCIAAQLNNFNMTHLIQS